MTWVRAQLAHVFDPNLHDETEGTWTGQACSDIGLVSGANVEETLLRHLVGHDEAADLIWEAPDEIAAAHNEALRQLIAADRAGDQPLAGELAEKVAATWVQVWAANCAVLEFLQDSGLSRFSPAKPQRWVVASFEHYAEPHGVPCLHIHNIVIPV